MVITTALVSNPTAEVKDYDVASALYGLTEIIEDLEVLELRQPIIEPEKVTASTILLHGIQPTRVALRKNGINPGLDDYPEQIQHIMGRRCRKLTWGEAQNLDGDWFIKPGLAKAWFGPSIMRGPFAKTRTSVGLDGDPEGGDAYGLANLTDEMPVVISELMEWVAEYRCFILHGEILDVRKYHGDYWMAPDREYVDDVVRAMGSDAPAGYAIDFGVQEDGTTNVIECNDGWALGSYGLNPVLYARLLVARWEQLWERKR